MSRTKLALVSSFGLLFAMFAFAGWGAMFPPRRAADAATSASLPRSTRLAAASSELARANKVSAADLWTAYMRDPAAADRQYRDRSLVVSGTVRSIDRDFDGGMLVRFSTGGASDTVNAKLAVHDDPTLMGINRGRDVSLLCVGRGSAIGAPLLGSCFVSSG